MKKLGIFYGTCGGKTEEIVKRLDNFFPGNECEFFNVVDGIDKISEFENIILATSTYGFGEVQYDWQACIENLKKIDFSNKIVAFIGTGDQCSFGNSYVGGMRELYDIVKGADGNIIGFTSIDGYVFDNSPAVIDNKFIGLVIDDSFDKSTISEKLNNWIENIKKELTFVKKI